MIIEKIKQYTSLQFLLFLFVLLAFGFSVYSNWDKPLAMMSPFFELNEIRDAMWFRLLIVITNFGFLILCVFELNNLLRDHHFAGESRMEQLLLLLVFIVLFPDPLFNLPLLLSIYFMLRSFKYLFLVHTQVKISTELALMAFFMSLCSMLFPPAAFIALLIYIGVLLQRGFYIKELLLYLIVFALPYYFLYSFFYLADIEAVYHWGMNLQTPLFDTSSLVLYLIIALGGLMLALMFFSFSYNSKEVLRSKAQFRNFYYLFYFALLWMLFVDTEEGVGMAFVPSLAIYVQSYPRLKKKWIIEGLLLLFALLGFIFQLLK